MNKVRLYWILQIGAWSVFWLIQIFSYEEVYDAELTTTQVIFYFLEALSFLLITHAFRTVMIKSGWLALNFSKLIPLSIAGVIVMGMMVYGIRILYSLGLGLFDQRAFTSTRFLGLTSVYALIAFFWTMAYVVYHYFERYNRTLQREAAMHEMELNNLKSQLNPHFIFNSLNSIRALVDEDPSKSKHAITQLSMILRNTLVSDQKSLTNFNEELRTVKNYLGLESIRYEERLRVDFDIDPGSSDFQVPPLMLQTLVENGIKHGISQLKEGGSIHIKSFVEKERLHIEIRNSGNYKKINGSRKKHKIGLGLLNTKKRLHLIYGDGAVFTIDNESKNTVLTELVLPKNSLTYESNNRR